jgi:hypothetical protein
MSDNLKSSAKETKTNRSLEPNVDESEFDLTSTDVKHSKNQQAVPPISLEEV